MANRKAKISKRSVDATACPPSGETRLWDEELTGFCLRAYSSGRKVYAVKYRVDGRQGWFTIGEHGSPWTPEAARKKASDVLYDAAHHIDPQAAKVERKADITVAELIALYLKDGPSLKPEKRASSWAADRGCLNNHVKPLIGSKVLRDVAPVDIGRMVERIKAGETAKVTKTKARGLARVRGGSGIAGRTTAVAKAMFTFAEGAGLLKRNPHGNPTKSFKVPKSREIGRFLTEKEVGKLEATMQAMEAAGDLSKAHGAVLRLLFLTGARKTEIVGLRWSEVDLERGLLDLPPLRTKAGGAAANDGSHSVKRPCPS